MIVTPDPSVLLKWFLPRNDEQDTDAVRALRDGAVAGTLDQVVSQLGVYQVGNTLARRFPDDAGELLASLSDSLSVKYRVTFRVAPRQPEASRP